VFKSGFADGSLARRAVRDPMLSTRAKLVLARTAAAPVVLARRLARLGPQVDVVRGGIRWRLDLREGIDFAIWLFGAFEASTRRAYERLVQPGHVVLDIGANVGAHALPLARLVGPGGRVVCFEPTEYAFAKLRANTEANPELAGRMTLMQVMLVGRIEEPLPDRLFSSWPLWAGGDVHGLHGGRAMATRGARALTLDAALAEAGVSRVDFVKMDVDGYECRVLRGAAELLRQVPPLLTELAPYVLDETGSSVEELIEILRTAGYALVDVTSGRTLPLDGRAIRGLVPRGSSMNVLATRSEPPR
jgi:FkbM family methyltransferase